MTFKRVCPPCLFLCLAALVSRAEAQSPNTASPASGGYSTDPAGFATAGDFSGSYLFGNDGGTYFLFDKMIGNGPGYPDGYTRLGLRAKLLDFGASHMWGSANALITDHTRVGVNAGGGYRWLFDANILSLHGWWDSYETESGFRYDQVSAGIELLHEDIDMRVNGYLPVGDEENLVRITDPGSVATFTSRGVGFFGQGLVEEALKGLDAEVGTPIFGVNWARIYAGGYWYDGERTSFSGVRGRVEAALSPDLSLNFIAQNDSEFDTNLQLGVEYRFSGGLAPGFFTPFHGEARKYNPVRRQWPVATRLAEVDLLLPMLNAKTGNAMTATFVDNRNSGPGDGSFENPFRELPSSDNADLILVFAGSGDTTGNITLRDEQQLLGEGKLYTFEDPLRGTVTLPEPFSSTGPRPVLQSDDPNRNVITLADWNRVANFDIFGPAPAAIGGTNVEGFEIDMVTATGVTNGIQIANASSTGIIRNSGFAADQNGIFVGNTGGEALDLLIEGGSMSLHPVDDLTTRGGTDGIHIHADGGDVNLTMQDVIVRNAGGRAVILEADGARMTADVDNIHARGEDDLLTVDVQDGEFAGSVRDANLFDSQTGSGVRLNLEDAVGQLRLENLIANRNAVSGIESDATGDGTDFLLSVIDSQLVANMGNGMTINVTDGAVFRHFVDPTAVTFNEGSGLEYNVTGDGSVYIADIVNTDFSENGLHAIDGFVFDGAYANVDLTNTPAVLAGANGYNLEVSQNSTFFGTVDTAQFSGAADAAIDLSVSDGSLLNLTMSDIQGQTNGNNGLRYFVGDGPNGRSDLFLAINDADFNMNPDSNIVGTAQGAGSRASVYLTNVTADGLGADGSVVLTATDGGILNQTWNGGTISQGDADGVVASVDGAGSQMRMNFTGVQIGTNSNGDGIDATLTGGGTGSLLDITLTDSSVTQNGVNGLDLSISGPGAISHVTIDNTPMGGNFSGDGFEFDVTNGAALMATASGEDTHFSGNGGRGWDGRVDGVGSFASLNVDGGDASQNGLEGGLFEVTAGGELNLTLANLAISLNQSDGLLTSVDGPGSIARITMDEVAMQGNGQSLTGDAFDASATGSGRIEAALSNMTVVGNRESGFRFDASENATIQLQMDNILADGNGRHGLQYHVTTGGEFDGVVTNSSFSGNGLAFAGDGVLGTADGAGSSASGVFQNVVADNNSRIGFEFRGTGGATLLSDIRDSSGSGNAFNGVRFTALDEGTMAFLKMMGPNTFDDNAGGDGVDFDAIGVNMAVANVTGSANNNGGDGINIRMTDVDSGSIALSGEGVGTVTGNAGDGIAIHTQNVTLTDKTVNGMLIPDFQVDGFTIEGNGGEPLVIDMTDTTFADGEITNNTIDGGTDGINVSLEGSAGDMLIDGNTVTNAARYGIAVTSGSGMHDVSITNNSVTGSGDTNIFVDLFGTTETGLMINDNTVLGGGTGMAEFNVGTNFTGTTLSTAPLASIPPDTMGAVGTNHVVEFLNNGVSIYDKTGVLLSRLTLDDFWLAAGLPDVENGTFDPRIIYDPTVDRWFAASIDTVDSGGNNIYVAVSDTSDPLGGWTGFRFVGDSEDDVRFNDFDTFGVDADGVYLATRNFDGPDGFDISIYSIPKADLIGPTPNIDNLSRFENLNAATFGTGPQPVVDFSNAADGQGISLAGFDFGGSELIRTDINDSDTATATLGLPISIPTGTYIPPVGGTQPGAPDVENDRAGFTGNVVRVGDSIWAAQGVLGSFGNDAVEWFEIDATTNQVIQSGVIEDPSLDFLYPSIAVNQAGAVVIGFSGSGPSQFISSMAAFGSTDGGGTTTFQTPQILQAGNANYDVDFGSGRNRWGDYSATVVDPTDPNTFWTFQEFVNGPDDFGVQITEVTFSQAVMGGTVNDGIHVDVRETAHLTDSTINGNTARGHGGDGIEVVVTDTAQVDMLTINDNESTGNGGDGIRFDTNGQNQLGGLSVSGNSDVSGNAGDGIEVSIADLDPASIPDVFVEANAVNSNMGDGIRVDILDSSVDDVSVSLNTVTANMGDGMTLNIDNTTGGVINADAVMVSSNMIERNAGDGQVVTLNNLTGLRSVDMRMSAVAENSGRGVVFGINNSPIEQFNISDNTIVNNMQGDALLIDATDSPIDVLTIARNQIGGAPDDAIDLRLDGSPVGDLQITDNSLGMVMGMMMNTGTPIDDSLPVIRTGFDTDNLPANDDQSTDLVPIGFDINFFGQTFSDTYVNNNGNITFLDPLFTFTPFDLLSTNTPIIAPFFSDVDTREGNIVTFGQGTVAGQAAFGVNWPEVRHFSVNGTNDGLPENTFQLVLIERSDIGAGDFDVEFNYDQILWEAGTASGSDEFGLGGSSARAGLSNGVDFALELPGSAINGAFLDGGSMSLVENNLNSENDGRYIFFFRDGALGEAAPSGGTGLEMTVVNGSDIGNMEITGNTIDGNGMHGVDITVQDSMLPTEQPIQVSDNTITNHENGDGFRMIDPDTNDTPFEIDLTNNTIGDNGGAGLNIALSDESGGLTATATGNDISNNGGIGASFTAAGDANLDLTFGDSAQGANILNANTDAGLAVTTTDTATATIAVENTTVDGTLDGANVAFDGDGLAVHASGDSVISSMTVGDDALQNTSFTNNAGNGIAVELSENASNANVLIQNVDASGNGGNGVGITRADFSELGAQITAVTADNNGGNGLDVASTGSQTPLQQVDVDNSSFSGNTIGMNYTVGTNAMLLTNATNNVIDGNTSHGISVTTTENAAFGDLLAAGGDPNSPLAVPSTFSSNVITGNGGNGLNFVAEDDSVQAIVVDDAGAVNSSTGTSRTVIDGNTGNQVQITGNGTSQQNVQLQAVNITNESGVDTGDGVNIAAGDDSTVTVGISGGTDGPSIIGSATATVGANGLGGSNVANGISADVTGQAILNLDVADVNLFNNTGDGVNIRNTGPDAGTTGVAQRQTIQASFDNIDARMSGDQGFDAMLDGNIGGRLSQLDTDDPVLIDITGSTFSSNENEGVFFQAAPGFTHGDPLYTDMVVTFNVVDSTIQSNGVNSISDGLVTEVGTNAYVLSTISGNTFGANGGNDFSTSSFDSGGDDNAAVFDLAFQDNSGDHIAPSALGATNGTPFFVLDNALTVEANNDFELFGVPQMEVTGPDGFETNGYLLRLNSNHGSATFPPLP